MDCTEIVRFCVSHAKGGLPLRMGPEEQCLGLSNNPKWRRCQPRRSDRRYPVSWEWERAYLHRFIDGRATQTTVPSERAHKPCYSPLKAP